MTTITIEIDDSGAIVLQWAEGAEYVENGLEGDTAPPEGDVCPIATQNIAANLEARDNAIAVANYGPLDPDQENADYWGAAADRWSVSVEEVKTARCGNCAAFNITSRIRACIADGVGGADAWEVVDAGELGYCEAFDFKCASARRCDAWVQGGPLTDELEQSMLPQPGDEEDLGQDEVEIKIVAPAWMAANARQGLRWVNEGYGGDGLTPQTMREARAMAGGTVSEDKAARMAAWFARHMVDLNAPAAMVGAEGYPSNGVVAHALWGGGSMTDSKRAAAWARARTAENIQKIRGGKMTKNLNVQMVGGAVKALGEGKIGGYLVRFTAMQSPDLTGDYFTSETDLGMTEALPVLYHHGQDAMIGKRVLGSGKLRKDDIGLWVEAQLALRDEYEASIYKLAEDGKLGWSSGAVAHLVEREQKTASVSWIKMWWVAEASLTPTPAEPRNEAATMKSGEAATPEDAVKASASVATENDGTENINEDTMMDNTNEIAELKASIAALTAAVNEPKVEVGKAAAVVSSLGGDHDGGQAFKHWIRTGQMNYYTKGNEQDWSSTKTNALNETTGTEGGILVPEGLYTQIIAKRDEMSVIRSNGALIIQTNLDTVQVPVENARMTTAIVAESGSYVAAEPTFTSNSVPIYKFGNQLRLTEELVADEQTNIMGYLSNGLGRAFGLMENQYCIAGTGSSQPKGLLTGGTAAITAASTTAITAAELVSLYHAMPEPYTSNPSEVIFITRNATLGALRALASSSVFTFNLQPQGDQGAQQLYGHKVAVSGYMQAATTGQKSLLVTNLAAGYILIERAGMVMSRNPYLLQATGQVALFTTMRFGGTTTVAEATQILTQA